jgi:lipopolysaccharide transport system ATP-binding protein
MADTVIRVENLGKKYIIGRQQEGVHRYKALRDVIADGAKSVSRKFLKPSGKKIFNPVRDEFWALKDVSFEIKQGDRVGIIGRNGAGKSTLLKILSRITEPTTGYISIKGRVASLLEVGTGFHPELTGRENIYLNGAILGMSRVEIKKKFDEIVAFAEVEKFLDTPVKRYSSGMYVRLAFAVAAHLEPEILIVDEVLAVGDAQFQKKCLGKMEEVGKKGRTVLFVSHNMATVAKLCNRAIYFRAGKIHHIDSTEKIIHEYLSDGESFKQWNITERGLIVTDTEIDVFAFYSCNSEGVNRNTFKTSEDIYFFIKYKLKHYISGLRVGIDLYSHTTGDILFRSFDDDIESQNREPGLVEALCKIPGNFLRAGSYSASLQIGVHNIRWIVDSTLIQNISVEFVDGVNGNYGDNRPGLLMPSLNWQIKRLELKRIYE